MIVVRLIGGLGNQMFQYATGRALALRHRSALALDLTWFAGQDLRAFEIEKFNIEATIASQEVLRSLPRQNTGPLNLLRRKIALRLGRHERFQAILEPHFHFFEGAANAGDNTYLEGYWQSEKYFADIRENLLDEFSLTDPLPDRFAELAEMILQTESVGVHIRRQDYITNPQAASVHGVMGMDYYHQGIATIVSEYKKPHFFLFTDDVEWAKENLHIDFPLTVCDRALEGDGIYDQTLMRQCKHFIIANSSFSWWAAWLCNNSDKIVVAPKRWFIKSGVQDSDLIPEGWIRL